MRALSAVRDVFELTQGALGGRVDRMLESGAGPADQLFLLQALLLSDENAVFWHRHWEALVRLYHIELGTQILLEPLALAPAMRTLLALLSAHRVPVALHTPWREGVQQVLRDTVLRGQRKAAPSQPLLWLGTFRDAADMPPACSHAVRLGDMSDPGWLCETRDALQSHGALRAEVASTVVPWCGFSRHDTRLSEQLLWW